LPQRDSKYQPRGCVNFVESRPSAEEESLCHDPLTERMRFGNSDHRDVRISKYIIHTTRDGGVIEFQRFVDKPQTGRVSSLRYSTTGADALPLHRSKPRWLQ